MISAPTQVMTAWPVQGWALNHMVFCAVRFYGAGLAFFPSLNYVINNVINYVGKWQESLLASSIPEKYSSWSLVRAV